MFSELTARHSGAYTCRVSNHAAAVNYTATLSVKGELHRPFLVQTSSMQPFLMIISPTVAPTWATEPLDAAVLLGAPLLLECAAKGYPAPSITWYRRIGQSVFCSKHYPSHTRIALSIHCA